MRRVSAKLNKLLCGCNLELVWQRLQQGMDSDRLRIRHLLQDLKQWVDAPIEGQVDIFVSGQLQLLEMSKFVVLDTIRSLMSAIEEREQVSVVLSRLA